jgi:type IV secretion/conjugal transfer VirB4 family ATPase
MRFLDEHRRRPAQLADHLAWAALVAPGVVLNKDGSFLSGVRFRGPDLESSTEDELMAVRARLNNALKRLGSGWCLHVEALRRRVGPGPESRFDIAAAWLVDEERRHSFDAASPAYETDYRLSLTWLPPADERRRLEGWLFTGGDKRDDLDWRGLLAAYEREVGVVADLLEDALPEVERLDDQSLLTWLHDCVSPQTFPVAAPETPMFLDAWLADAPLLGGVSPRLGEHALEVVSIRGLPAVTRPGLLDALGDLPFSYRWSARWIAMDKVEAENEIVRLRKRWFAKRKGLGVLLREAITREEIPLLDTDSVSKVEECDGALAALGAETCAYGYLTLTVSVLDPDEAMAAAKARSIVAALNAQGLVARIEDLNAVDAWLGSLPGEPYADARRPMISTLNLADILPVSAVWAGPAEDACLKGPPLSVTRTSGSTPFRLSLHVGDVGHAMVVGPTGSGKSALLAFLSLQWLRYPESRVIFLDKGRSIRAAALAAEGSWRALEPDGGLSLKPLARIDGPVERAWASEWISDIAASAGVEPSPQRRAEVWEALQAMAGSPPEQRTLSVFCGLLQDRAVTAALQPFTLDGPYGALLDGEGEPPNATRFEAFELETIMATPSAVAPVLAALFRRLERDFDGRPTLLILDEAWLFLDSTAFAARIREWLKTLRKKRVAVVFATQSLDDVAASSIAASLIESCPTQVFLPNPRALEPGSAELYSRFGLNARQLELIAYAAPKRAYYWRQPQGRRLFDLRLEGAALALCGSSAPEDHALIDQILEHGADGGFARAFLKAKGVSHVDTVFDAFAAH